MEIVGLVISILALLLALFTYFKHDLKIKQQASLLNKYQLEKIEKEKEEDRKAIIEANVINGDKGKKTIKIYNKGKSVAKNVNVEIPDIDGFQVVNNPCPIDIRPQNGIDIILVAFIGRPNKVEIEFEWSDDFNASNRDKQTIQL
jgi:hypothetical protein